MRADDKPQSAAHLTSTAVGDELLVLDEAAGQIHQLNRSAALVFEACNGDCTVSEIEARLQQTFGIDADLAHRDVQALLTTLTDKQLLIAP